MKLSIFLVLSLSVALSFAPFAKGVPCQLQKDINQFLKPFVDDDRFSGTVLAAKGGNVIVNKGYGEANRELGIKNHKHDPLRVASLTKAMTAAVVLSLRDSNQLTLNDTVGQYLNDYPIAENVTIRQLLGHTSGIPDYTLFADFPVFQRQSYTTSTLIDVFRNMSLEFTPGSQFSYSNSGYAVLAAILETVTSKDLATLLKDLVFDPVGLSRTQVDNDLFIIEDRVSGYIRTSDPTNPVINAPYIDASVASGAAQVISTTEEYYLFLRSLVNAELLNASSVTEMFTAGLGDYGFGVRVATHPTAGPEIWHDGAINGFFTSFRVFDTDDLYLVVFANIMDAPSYFGQVIPGLESIVLNAGL